MSWIRRILRAAPGVCAAGLLTSCTDIGGDLPSIYQVAKNLWQNSSEVPLREAAATPYASIGVRVGGNDQFMLVMATQTNGQQLWTSDARVAITTRDGRIVRTAGFGRDLSGLNYTGNGGDSGGRIVWQADFADLGLYSIPVTCRRGASKDESIVVLGTALHTRRIEEACTADSSQIKWSYTNIFWLDPENGLAWRSLQYVHPKLPPFEITVLRPPA